MNKDIKVKDYNQKPNKACPAQTEADSELQPKITTSCPACSNTFVGSSCYTRSLHNLMNTNTIELIANNSVIVFETIILLAFTAKIIAATPSMQT